MKLCVVPTDVAIGVGAVTLWRGAKDILLEIFQFRPKSFSCDKFFSYYKIAVAVGYSPSPTN